MTYYMNVYRTKNPNSQDYIRWAYYKTKEHAIEDRHVSDMHYKKTISIDIDPRSIDDTILTTVFPNINFHNYGWSKYL